MLHLQINNILMIVILWSNIVVQIKALTIVPSHFHTGFQEEHPLIWKMCMEHKK